MYVGFEVSKIQQIKRKKDTKSGAKKGGELSPEKDLPYISLFKLFDTYCNAGGIYLIIDSERKKFFTSVSGVEGIVNIENYKKSHFEGVMKYFVKQDIIKGIFVHGELPLVVIDTKKLFRSFKEKVARDKKA